MGALTLLLLLYSIFIALVLFFSIISEKALPSDKEKTEVIKNLEEKFDVKIKVSRLTSNARIIGFRYIFVSPVLYKYLSPKSLKYVLLHEIGHIGKPTLFRKIMSYLSSFISLCFELPFIFILPAESPEIAKSEVDADEFAEKYFSREEIKEIKAELWDFFIRGRIKIR